MKSGKLQVFNYLTVVKFSIFSNTHEISLEKTSECEDTAEKQSGLNADFVVSSKTNEPEKDGKKGIEQQGNCYW